jgi:hypothetical protein
MTRRNFEHRRTRQVRQLEDLADRLRGPSRGGDFVRLIAALLKEMGFTDVYVRKGTENGRDIDARLGAEVWFFECKYAERTVDTPNAAYKLLQVDALSHSVQPDHYVFVTNGVTASILRDIATMKNADPSVAYVVHFWSDDEQKTLRDVLLSYPDAYVGFVEANNIGFEVQRPDLVSDFRARSAQHIREHQRFLTRFRSTAAAGKHRITGDAAIRRFALDQTFQICSVEFSKVALGVVTMAIPSLPIATLHNFRDLRTLQHFTDTMGSLAAAIAKVERDHIVFQEDTTRTIITNFGSIVMINDTIDVRGEIHIPEWIADIREQSVRVRNFTKLGILPVPFDIKAYIIGRRNNSTQLKLAEFGGMARRRNMFSDVARRMDDLFLILNDKARGGERDKDGSLPAVHFESAMVTMGTPPEMHTEMARSLASSLWTLSGKTLRLEVCAKKWLSAMRARAIRGRWDSVPFEVLEYFDSIWWLAHTETLDRDFGVFQGILRGGAEEAPDVAAWQRRAAELLKSIPP